MNSPNLLVILVAIGLGAGCAATIPTELASARRAYQTASTGPAATLVPSDVHQAHEALLAAEASFDKDPKGFHTKDLAYVAQRKAELAQALAAAATEEKTAASANAQYQSTQDAIMKNTRNELDATQVDLAATKATAESTAAQLSISERARVEAEARARDAMAALAKLAAVKEESRGLVITLSGSVLFASDEAVLLPEARTRLGQVADALMATKERRILIEGHTDSQGSDEHNMGLSQRRAEAVRMFLTERGYDPAKVRSAGIGEARPVADNATAEGRANNRRVEIVIEPTSSAAQ